MKRGSLVLLLIVVTLSSLVWAQQEVIPGKAKLTNAYGIWIRIDGDFVKRSRQIAAQAQGEAADVVIEINGRKTTMTFEEFEKRVFEKEAK